jgi:hypothetical protein
MSLNNYTRTSGEVIFPSVFISNNIEFGQGDVRIGNLAGANNQQSTALAVGDNAGQNNQSIGAVAVGTLAGVNNQGQDSIAIGTSAGADNQQNEAVAVGRRAGNDFQGVGAVAVGDEAGDQSQGAYSVAVGYQAGFALQDTSSVAVGALAGENSQGSNCVAVGDKAGQFNQGNNSVAIGAGAGNNQQHSGTIILNATGDALNSDRADAVFMAPVRNVASTDLLYYNSSTNEVSFAPAPSVGVPSLETVLSQGNNADIYNIDMSGNDILNVDNIDLQTINGSVYPPPSVNPSLETVLNVGNVAGTDIDMSNNDILKVGNLGFTLSSVSIGNGAGGKNNDDRKVNVGFGCGNDTQQSFAVAIGNQCGNQLQKASAVAIGNQAGRFNQGVGAIAIGNRAGDSGQGERSIAIGRLAGFTNQHTQTIILNASDISLNSDVSNAFYVNPVRNAVSSDILYYNTTNKEISYAPAPTISTPSLETVLSVGNKAGTDIDMSSNNLLNVNNINLSTINNSAYPPIVPPPSYSVVSFTPVLSGFSANTKTGYYQKIGNMVIGWLSVSISVSYIGTPSFISIDLPVSGTTYNTPVPPMGSLYYRTLSDTVETIGITGGVVYQATPVNNRFRLLATENDKLVNMKPTNTSTIDYIAINFSYLCDDSN